MGFYYTANDETDFVLPTPGLWAPGSACFRSARLTSFSNETLPATDREGPEISFTPPVSQ